MNETPVNNSTDQIPVDTAPAPVTPDVMPKKKNRLPWLFGFLALAVILTASFLILIVNQKKMREKSAAINESELTPSPSKNSSFTSQPTVYSTLQPTSTDLPRYKDPWQKYESGQNIDGITINYPKGWKINYTKEYNLGSDYEAKYRLGFDFAPPGWIPDDGAVSNDWMGWGVIFFDVYNPQTDVNQWINKYALKFKNDLIIEEGAKIGGKPTSQIQSKVSQFGALLIFGSNYTYDLSHSQNGSDDFVKDWTSIFKYININ